MKKVLKNAGKIKKAGIAVLMSLGIMAAVPVFAENHAWSGNEPIPGADIITEKRTKKTDSSVIANYSQGNSIFVTVAVEADDNGRWRDATLYTTSHPDYKAYMGTYNYIDVLNQAYEKYRNQNNEVSVRAVFTTTASGAHRGKWRPDV